MDEYKTIYDLCLHETLTINSPLTGLMFIIRVPGGWIYISPRLDSGSMNSTFIPYNNEFCSQDKPKEA